MRYRIVLTMIVIVLVLLSGSLSGQDRTSSLPLGGNKIGDDNLPTTITADRLEVNAKDKTFKYSDNVRVERGDVIMLAKIVEGEYTEDNKIKIIKSRDNVDILRADGTRARADLAIYETAKETITLKGNPSVEQGGSILFADLIKIYLIDNRADAVGNVRMTVVKKEVGNDSTGENAR